MPSTMKTVTRNRTGAQFPDEGCPPENTGEPLLFRKIAEKQTGCRLQRLKALARDDQALAGHDHPTAVLAADGINPAEARDEIAGVDFVGAPPAIDQRA